MSAVLRTSLQEWLSSKKRQLPLLVYPSLLFIGTVIRAAIIVINGKLPDTSSSYLLQSTNVFNAVFAAHSFEFTFIGLCGIAVLLILRYAKRRDDSIFNFNEMEEMDDVDEEDTDNENRPVLPVTNRDSNFRLGRRTKEVQPRRILITQSLKCLTMYSYLTLLIIWCFGNSLYDRVQMGTGGACHFETTSPFYGSNPIYHKCLSEGGTWDGGIKLSGHSLILSCFGTLITYELRILARALRRVKVEMNNFMILTVVVIGYCLLLKSIYLLLYFVTAVFFHTLFEKIVGTLCGLLVPFTIYCYRPTSKYFIP